MLQPDNYVQNATSTQAFNRYSYVTNNPLKYTDPSGWTKYYDIDGPAEHTWVTYYGVDWNGPGSGNGGGVPTYNYGSTTTTTYGYDTEKAGLYGYKGGENVPIDYSTSTEYYGYTSYSRPNYSGLGNTNSPVNFSGSGGSSGSSNSTSSRSSGIGIKLNFPLDQGSFSNPKITFGDRIQNVPIFGDILDNLFVPLTK